MDLNKLKNNTYRQFFNSIHKVIGKSTIFTKIAVFLNFHIKRSFKYHLSDTPLLSQNGEELIISLVGHKVKFFIDVGACIGFWTEAMLKYSDYSTKGIAYEPNSKTFIQLSQRLKKYQNLTLKKVAVGETEKQVIFYKNLQSPSLSSLVIPDTLNRYEQETINMISLDKDLIDMEIEKVDFLKIDAEGYDFQVLQGACKLLEKQAIGLIQFEYGITWIEAGNTLKETMNYLKSYNYEVFLIKSKGLYRLNYDWYGEYFEYSNFLAISPLWKWVKKELYQGSI